jgi:hypothetical protein
MNPTTTTIVLSLLISCLFLMIGAWALVHGGTRKQTPKPRGYWPPMPLPTPPPPEAIQTMRKVLRRETPCPDCKYGEPCAKCLGAVQ